VSSPRSHVAEFLQARALIVSASTVKGDSGYLWRFLAFLEAQGVTELQAIRPEHLFRYHDSLKEAVSRFGKPLSESTIYRAMIVPQLFLAWAQENGVVLLDFDAYQLEKPARKPVAVPRVDQVAMLLEAPDISTPEGLRDRLILECFYTLGIRRRECHGLSIEDLDLGAATVKIAGKGRRERLLPLSPRLVELLTRYLWDARLKLRPHPGRDGALDLGADGAATRVLVSSSPGGRLMLPAGTEDPSASLAARVRDPSPGSRRRPRCYSNFAWPSSGQ
jgi:integrase/recombinase XerD